MSAIRDITDRKKAEQKFRDLLEAAPDAIVIVNRAGAIVLVNSQTEKLFGYQREALLGQPIEVLIPKQQFPLLACESYTTYVGGCPYLPFGD